jgi:hypothetical protein
MDAAGRRVRYERIAPQLVADSVALGEQLADDLIVATLGRVREAALGRATPVSQSVVVDAAIERLADPYRKYDT